MLTKRAVVFLVCVLGVVGLFDSGSLTRFLHNEMVKWNFWSFAALPTVTSGMHVLDLSTVHWTVSNGGNVTVPGSLPSVVCLTPAPVNSRV